MHPVDCFLSQTIPQLAPYVILNMHPVVLWMGLCVGSINAVHTYVLGGQLVSPSLSRASARTCGTRERIGEGGKRELFKQKDDAICCDSHKHSVDGHVHR